MRFLPRLKKQNRTLSGASAPDGPLRQIAGKGNAMGVNKIYAPWSKEWIIEFRGSVKKFKTEAEADEYADLLKRKYITGGGVQ